VAPGALALTEPAALTSSLTCAVEAAAVGDLQAYDQAQARLSGVDPARLNVVTGTLVRGLLEELHPGGLTGDDVGEVLRGAALRALWLPDLDPAVLLVVVTGALGLLDAEDQPVQLAPAAVQRHAPVLVASLLASLAAPVGPRLAAALAELRRAETVELP